VRSDWGEQSRRGFQPRFLLVKAAGSRFYFSSCHSERSRGISQYFRDMKVRALIVAIAVFVTGSASAQDKIDKRDVSIRYVAIGDSYSIGEGASPDESWPALLTRHLNEKGLRVDLVANPSVTGWTTQQAIDRELPVFLSAKPNFATLQIGVNDWVQGVDAETFRKHVVFLLDQMLGALQNKNRLLVVTIPDFGVTPTGLRYARGRNISEGIVGFNKIITDEAAKRGLRVVDVIQLSQKMRDDHSLVAGDGLHPSAKEYAEWEKIIFPAALELLQKSETMFHTKTTKVTKVTDKTILSSL
jgi:lysophospholipase L1-like esterase